MALTHPHSNNSTFAKVFKERITSLLEDRYCLRVKSESTTIWYARLKHMANGNEITLMGYPRTGVIEQWTNHVKTYQQTFPRNAV